VAQESELDRRRQALQNLILAQQFLVQRLEQIESNTGDDARSDKDLVPETSSNNELSRVLNASIFNDEMTASDRQWTTRSERETTAAVDNFARLVAVSNPSGLPVRSPANAAKSREEPVPAPSIKVKIIFQPISPEYQKVFRDESRSEQTAWIEIGEFDRRWGIKYKALEQFDIWYHPKYYDFHRTSPGCEEHIWTWGPEEFQQAKDWVEGGSEPVLSMQNTLWQSCRQETPEIWWWGPRLYAAKSTLFVKDSP
jgi:hypothetical protein